MLVYVNSKGSLLRIRCTRSSIDFMGISIGIQLVIFDLRILVFSSSLFLDFLSSSSFSISLDRLHSSTSFVVFTLRVFNVVSFKISTPYIVLSIWRIHRLAWFVKIYPRDTHYLRVLSSPCKLVVLYARLASPIQLYIRCSFAMRTENSFHTFLS